MAGRHQGIIQSGGEVLNCLFRHTDNYLTDGMFKIDFLYTNVILAILLLVKMNEIEGTRPNSCSQAFAR